MNQKHAALIEVKTSRHSYPVIVQQGLLQQEAARRIAALAGSAKVSLVTQPKLHRLYGEAIVQELAHLGVQAETKLIQPGERSKNLKQVARLYSAWAEQGMDRKSLAVALGGGVISDLAGFAAATWLRGIRVMNLPTSLLAQVDAAIGGKTGVDLPQGKNLAGAFHPPCEVLIDPLCLATLPMSEIRSGMAEVLKYGIIYDEQLFEEAAAAGAFLQYENRTKLTPLIARCCAIKAEVVSHDETEQGLRAILNFGHTLGHALEAATFYKRYLHGEAIAVGMVSAALIGTETGITPPETADRIVAALRSLHLPTALPDDISDETLLQAARMDKKSEAGRLRWVLADRMGHTIVTSVEDSAVYAALKKHRQNAYA